MRCLSQRGKKRKKKKKGKRKDEPQGPLKKWLGGRGRWIPVGMITPTFRARLRRAVGRQKKKRERKIGGKRKGGKEGKIRGFCRARLAPSSSDHCRLVLICPRIATARHASISGEKGEGREGRRKKPPARVRWDRQPHEVLPSYPRLFSSSALICLRGKKGEEKRKRKERKEEHANWSPD